MAQACRAKGLAADALLQEITADLAVIATDWTVRPLDELIDHIQVKYHGEKLATLAALEPLPERPTGPMLDKARATLVGQGASFFHDIVQRVAGLPPMCSVPCGS